MSDTPITDAAQRGDFVHVDIARALERSNAALREVGNELCRIVSVPADSNYDAWPSDVEIDAAISAWRKL